MRWTKTLIPTLKEVPQEAEAKSHRLMLRAGLIRKLASGTYNYLPLGLRALNKAIAIVREEMDRAGALEVLLPAIHPVELWKESGRCDILGDDMIHFKDRHGRENVLGPTHEEVITDLVRREVRSYKQLPLTLYQIQTKFRDEMRPRSGVIRSREFIMKDAYSFHATAESLDETYEIMRRTYERIFKRCGLEFYVVQADPGAMGGNLSQEFVLFSDAGEDWMVQVGDSDRVVSVEMARRKLKGLSLPQEGAAGKRRPMPTPGHSSVESVSKYLKKKPSDLLKTMIYEALDPTAPYRPPFAVLVRGDHEVSNFKVREKVPGAYMASPEVIQYVGSRFGFSGPLGLHDKNDPIPFYIDEDVLLMKDFITGANEKDLHFADVNLMDILNYAPDRKIVVGDFRQALPGDKGVLENGEETELHFRTAIELGHIFKLGCRYSEPFKAQFLDKGGKLTSMVMGCYGIGINRILAAAVEQYADEKGIVWPQAISPFRLLVLVLDPGDARSLEIARSIEDSEELARRGIDILVDDRDETPGVKFNDADLIGIPFRVVIGPKALRSGKVEIKIRKTSETLLVDIPQVVSEIVKQLG
ncbi:MAG: proline--tRNA ligase [Candidatus Omnitrophica bacterium]|nr:proline--tRNA ligase [Candidatus Omnitrophota bacterium]